jgi:predicted AlkP superfamily phosphohydrolase/phosphomutase
MTRVLFIGLDAADRDLVRQLADEGAMPAVRSLIARGSSYDIVVPDAFYVGAVWPSFYTAAAPTRHGRYCFKQYSPGSYKARPVAPDIVPMAPFWSALDAAGRRVVIFDVPKSRPVPLEHGIQVCDWGTHDPEGLGLATEPASLANDIVVRAGPDPVGNCDQISRTANGIRSFTRNLKRRIATKETMAVRAMTKQPWDFFAVCFGDSHCVGHQCWHLHDPAHERHDPAIASAVGDPVRDVYGALDASVGRLIEAAGPDCLVFLLCSHGMGRHYDGGHLMRDLLKRINRTMPFGRSLDEQRTAYKDARHDAEAIDAGIAFDEDGLPIAATRRSFLVPNNDAFVGIRLNLVGRERYGRIEPADAVAYGDALMSALKTVTIGEGGPPAFDRIFRTESAYPDRKPGDALPDIIAAWSRLAPYRALSAPDIGTVEGAYAGVRTGDHRAGGRLFVAGAGIAPGARGEAPIEAIGPTICSALSVPLPSADGKPIPLSRPSTKAAAARAMA